MQTLEELIPFTEDILASGNMGVAVRMGETSLKFKCKQKEFTKALIKSLHMPDDKKGKNAFLVLLLTLSTYDVIYEAKKVESEDKEGGEESTQKETIQVRVFIVFLLLMFFLF